MSSANYGLNWNVIGGGGGDGSSFSYTIQGTIGQMAGLSVSPSFKLQGGFWKIESIVTGTSNVGIFRPSTHMFYLKNGTTTWTTTAINWGTSTDLPVTGDWNMDGTTEVGVFRPSTHTFYLRPANYPATPPIVINWGESTDLPVTGDWNMDGMTEVGVFRPSTHTFYLRPANWPATPTTSINWGVSTDLPVTGTWV